MDGTRAVILRDPDVGGFVELIEKPPDHASAKQVAPQVSCTRESLQAAVDSYLAAQQAGDRSRMAFADKVRYLENMSEVAAE